MKKKFWLISIFGTIALIAGGINWYYSEDFYCHKSEFNEVVIESDGYTYSYLYDVDQDYLFIPSLRYYRGTTGSLYKAILITPLIPKDCIPWIFKAEENEYWFGDCDLVDQKISQAFVADEENEHMLILRQMQKLAHQKWPELNKWTREAKIKRQIELSLK